MDQYGPEGRVGQYKKLGRCITSKEFSNTIQLAKKYEEIRNKTKLLK